MSASARFHRFLRRVFGRRPRPESQPAQNAASEPQPSRAGDPMPLFSLSESKQELVASYRNLESESA